MGTVKRIIKNTAWLTIAKVSGDLLVFFFLMYFGREFGKTILGKYSLAMSIGAILSVFYSFGFNTFLTRAISRDDTHESKFVGHLLLARTALAFVAWSVLSTCIWLVPFDDNTKLIVIIISGYHVFYRLGGLLRAAFIAHEAMHYPAFMEFFHRVVILGFGCICLLVFDDPVITLAVYPLSSSLMFALGLVIYRIKFGRLDFHLDLSFVKKAIVASLPFLLIAILTQLYARVGIIILTVVRGESEAGLFAASDRLFVAMTTTLTMLSHSLFPVMSRYAVIDNERLIGLARLSSRWLAIILIPTSFAITLFSHEIIAITFGADFKDSAIVLQILSWALTLIGLNYVLSNLLIVGNQESLLVRIRSMVYGFHIFMSMLLIGMFHYVGLACARLISEAILFIVMLVCIQSTLKSRATSIPEKTAAKKRKPS